MSRLSVELVPATCWYSNVRSNVSRGNWEKCKRYVRERSGSVCEVCGGRGPKWPVEAHEVWHYDDDRQIQTLVDLIALCPACHEVKHIGRTMTQGNLERATNHLMTVNGWSVDHTVRYVETAFAIHLMRSQMEWTLNISFLGLLGISTTVSDRRPGVSSGP